jgi:hypothetical protein
LFIYVNGTRLINQASASFGVNSNNLLYFGDYFGQTTSNAASHYQCDVRFVKGTALYTGATLTIPTTPLTAVTNTSYLLNYTNAGILDNAMMNDLETVGNAQISTSVKKYGTGSLAFDGTGDWLYTPSKPILQLGSSNFTIECWVYLNSTSGAQRPISQSDNNYQFAFYIASGGGLTAYSFQSSGTQNFAISMGTLSINTWYHIACVRNGTTVTAYLNGTSTGTATLSGAIDDRSGGWRFGANYVGTDALNGYIDDVRFTMYPRYTANFTPPTSAFPNQ